MISGSDTAKEKAFLIFPPLGFRYVGLMLEGVWAFLTPCLHNNLDGIP